MTPTLTDLTEEYGLREGLTALQDYIYGNARDKGFHEDADLLAEATEKYKDDPLLSRVLETARRDRTGNRLMLIVGEIVEGHEEIRSGREANERYYSFPKDAEPYQGETPIRYQLRTGTLVKPEGLASELADAVIRAFDQAGDNDIDLPDAILEKLGFNAQRSALHGGKKF